MAGGAVGLVLDSVSAADQAVCAVMREFLTSAGIDHEVLAPARVDPSRHPLLVVGSGSALPRGSLPPGAHVLNAASLADPAEPGILDRYRYVSVRTSPDRERLEAAHVEAAFVPSVVTRLAAGASPGTGGDRLGIHLDAAAWSAALHWHEPIRALRGLRTVGIALEPSGGEQAPLTRLLHAAGNGELATPATAGELLELVGGLRLLVCSSLHAAILAWRRNVPVLLFPSEAGAEAYLRDRGLGPWVFRSPEELGRKATMILDAVPDYGEIVARDEALCETHFALLREALRGTGAVAVPAPLRAPSLPPPTYRFDAVAVSPPEATGREADQRLRAFVTRLGAELDRLHGEIASQRARIAELAREVDRLQGEVVRREALLEEMRRSRAWRFAVRFQEIVAAVRRRVGAGARSAGDAPRGGRGSGAG